MTPMRLYALHLFILENHSRFEGKFFEPIARANPFDDRDYFRIWQNYLSRPSGYNDLQNCMANIPWDYEKYGPKP